MGSSPFFVGNYNEFNEDWLENFKVQDIGCKVHGMR
jgi:hypothetical protein